jgi:hypothetical protein
MFARLLLCGALFFALVSAALPARALDFDISGYGDVRLVASPKMTSWLNGGLGKFRYGGNEGNFRFAEAVARWSAPSRNNAPAWMRWRPMFRCIRPAIAM